MGRGSRENCKHTEYKKHRVRIREYIKHRVRIREYIKHRVRIREYTKQRDEQTSERGIKGQEG